MSTSLVEFDNLVSDLTAFVAPVKDLSVSDKESCERAVITLKEIKFWEKKIEEKRKELVGPLNDQVKKINEYAKTVLAPLGGPELHIKGQLMAWERVLEKEREEARRIEREAQAKREEEARVKIAQQQKEADEAIQRAKEDAEALAMFATGDEAASINARVDRETEQVKAQAHMEAQRVAFEAKQAHWDVSKEIKSNKVSGTTRRWVHEVLDANQVPPQFLIVDEKKVREHYMAEIKKGNSPVIAGIRIFQETSISVR